MLALAGSISFFWGLGRFPLIEPDEGRNAEVAREMLLWGRWLTPHYDGLTYLDKPPMLFWMIAGSFKAFGFTEWAARLPSALAALAVMFLAAYLGCRMYGRDVGFRTGFIFATAPLVIVFSRFVIFDMLFTLLVTVALVSFWQNEGSSSRSIWRDVLAFAAAGLATLTKGPVGFLLPLLIIFVYELLRGRLNEIRKLHWKWGLAVFSLIVLPWFIVVSLRHPDFPRYALWNESLLRFATRSAHREGGPFYYVPVYLAGFFPWSLFLLAFGIGQIRKWRKLLRESSPATLFLLSWVGVILIFFSISQSKLPGYFLPALVPLPILMAKAWTEAENAAKTRVPGWMTAGFAALALLGAGVFFAFEWGGFQTIQKRLEHKIPADALALAKPEILYSSLLVVGLAVLGRDMMGRARRRWAATAGFAVVALTTPLLLIRWLRPIELYASADSSRALARTIERSPERNLPVYGFYYFRTGLPFYLRRPVGLVTATADELTSNYVAMEWRRLSRNASGMFLPLQKSQELAWNPKQPLLVRAKDWKTRKALVITQGIQVPILPKAMGEPEPLWTGWRYSVWQVNMNP